MKRSVGLAGEVKEVDDDPILGVLAEDDDRLTGTIPLGGLSVSLTIDADGGDMSAAVSVARSIAATLEECDRTARTAAAAALLVIYNDGWRRYQETLEDGSLRDVAHPQLSAAEFMSRLRLTAVTVLGDGICDLFYADDGMFWGHSVVVSSFDSRQFGDLHVELSG